MKNLSFWSLRVLLLLLVFFSVAPALGLIFYTASEQRRFATIQAQENALQLARLASSHHDGVIEAAHQLLAALARLSEVRNGNATACDRILADLLKQYPIYANFGVIGPDKRIFCSAIPHPNSIDASDRAYVQQAFKTHDFAIGDYQIGRITKKASINFGYPVLDGTGRIQVVVFAALDLTWLNQIAANANLPAHSTLTLTDRHGIVLTRYPDPEKWVGKSEADRPLARKILDQGEGVADDQGLDGIPRLYAFTPLHGAPEPGSVYVSVGIPKEAAFAQADRILMHNLIGLGVVGILALGAGWVFGDLFILRRIHALIHFTKQLTAGDLSVRTGLSHDRGELGQLAQAFDDMTQSLSTKTAAVKYEATHDPLTGLPNRFLLQDRLQQVILTAHRENKPVALLLLDIDRFKEVNNALGHPVGDILLKQFGLRIREVLRESDTLARLEGDKFAGILPSAGLEGAMLVANKIRKNLERPFLLEGLSLDVNASMGIALYPEHGMDAVTLIQKADIAMYVSKESGEPFFTYAASRDQNNLRRLTLIGELRQAIKQDQLFLLYQPQISLQTGRISGVEALVRWKHPQHGVVPPDQFILPAEQTGLIKPLTLWVLKEALRQCGVWQREGIQIGVAVNLSARNLLDPKLPDQISEILQTSKADPEWLELEITESVIMTDPLRAMDILTRLNKMGIRFSIDDFGTGYSSLSYLRRFPIDTLKIDRSFVKDITENPDDQAIVSAIIVMAHRLKLSVVAEGVETERQLAFLRSENCDSIQGYLFCRPVPVDEFKELWMSKKSIPEH
ncbi:MAG: EAL domain-containing protein [Nitrospirae bacterium]|nr:EAL domain-containing protein [Nitrospirota bacterium]